MVFSLFACFFFFKQKTAYELRISDWSSDVCSSDLEQLRHRVESLRTPQPPRLAPRQPPRRQPQPPRHVAKVAAHEHATCVAHQRDAADAVGLEGLDFDRIAGHGGNWRACALLDAVAIPWLSGGPCEKPVGAVTPE